MKQHIRQVAREMATEMGLINIDRRELCVRANIAPGSFQQLTGCTFTDLISELKTEGVGIGNHAVTRARANPELHRLHLLDVALNIAKKVGYTNLTRNAIAESAGVSMGLVTNYLGTLQQLHRTLMRHAVKNEIVEIVAQGLANKDKHALKASPELKNKAAQLIANS